jgi:hypothetical protein
VIRRDGTSARPCPNDHTHTEEEHHHPLHRPVLKGNRIMKIRMLAVSGAALVAVLGTGGPAAAATSTAYDTEPHRSAVVQLAASEDDPATPGGGNDPNGQQQQTNPQIQQPNPAQQVPTQTDSVQTHAGGGAIAAGTVAVLLLGTICFFLVKKGGFKASHLALGICLGVLLAGTFIGPLVQQVTGSAVTSLGAVLSGM